MEALLRQVEAGLPRIDRITASTTRAVFILDGLAALGEGGLQAAGQALAGHLADLHPGARLSWRQLGADPADGS